MAETTELTKEFNDLYDAFIEGCVEHTEVGRWDTEQYGDMGAYYSADLMSVAVYMASADGSFVSAEAESMNELLGFSFSIQELEDIYNNVAESLESLVYDELQEDFTMLKDVDEELADSFKELLTMECRIIAECDMAVVEDEQDIIEAISYLK